MSQHSIAEARDHLSDLIDRAIAGDAVVITREGRPPVEIRAVEQTPAELEPFPASNGRTIEEMLAWLASNRIGPISDKDSATLVREMRDEGY